MSSNRELFKTFYRNMELSKDIDPSIWMSRYIINRMELNQEQVLWFCFLNAITYHLPTAYLIFNEFPDLENVGVERLSSWWVENKHLCPFQTDKNKQKPFLPKTVESYKVLVAGSQVDFFERILTGKSSEECFFVFWNKVYKPIFQFGRFSVWNWVQMLDQVAGLGIKPNNLLLGEQGSSSHTEGACAAFGMEPKKIYSCQEKTWLEKEAKKLMEKLNSNPYDMETVFCAFKKLFRSHNSRYVGYYLDRQYEDIVALECNWKGVDWKLLHDARQEVLGCRLDRVVNKELFKLIPEDKVWKID